MRRELLMQPRKVEKKKARNLWVMVERQDRVWFLKPFLLRHIDTPNNLPSMKFFILVVIMVILFSLVAIPTVRRHIVSTYD